MSITKSRRTKFTAAHLAPETKDALTKKAKREKKSVSAVVSEAVEEKLERDGCNCAAMGEVECPTHGSHHVGGVITEQKVVEEKLIREAEPKIGAPVETVK